MKKILDFIKSLCSRNVKTEVYKNSIKGSHIQIYGNVSQSNNIVKLEGKEAVEEFTWQLATFLKDNYCVDTQSDKFQFHINQAILILKLNDSELKRETLKNLLYMKFAGSDLSEDDSDAPLTLALDAMRYLTDKSLRHLTSYRLLVNVLPSLMIHDDMNDLSRLNDFINQNGLFSIEEVINLQRCGVIHEMSASVYSLETFANYTHSGINLSEYTHPSEENIIFANSLTPAGVIITDITLGYFLNLKEQYNHWLPIRNKSLHVNDLIVDKDAHINQNMIVRGDTASGGGIE